MREIPAGFRFERPKPTLAERSIPAGGHLRPPQPKLVQRNVTAKEPREPTQAAAEKHIFHMNGREEIIEINTKVELPKLKIENGTETGWRSLMARFFPALSAQTVSVWSKDTSRKGRKPAPKKETVSAEESSKLGSQSLLGNGPSTSSHHSSQDKIGESPDASVVEIIGPRRSRHRYRRQFDLEQGKEHEGAILMFNMEDVHQEPPLEKKQNPLSDANRGVQLEGHQDWRAVMQPCNDVRPDWLADDMHISGFTNEQYYSDPIFRYGVS
ncbi:MAG: hypothetical protein M1814_000225 [Vezdaea aestivalis]|nr:MAG: hypothetical protein M1814_000225 [Vezdaea aestivalis]